MDSQRHMSPDGRLCLIVETVNDDLIVGFERYAWHTHGDMRWPRLSEQNFRVAKWCLCRV
jgi:hypothetical protein